MIAFITICYAALIWLLVFKLGVIGWNGRTKVAIGGENKLWFPIPRIGERNS